MHKSDENQGCVTPKELERGRLLFAAPCDFFYGAVNSEHLPPLILPEVAFAGRSNVGKSSLLNALTGRKSLARASSEPGRTKQLNFFNLGNELTLVDMPGYGFAKAAKSVKESWQQTMFLYLRGRPTLVRVYLLLDARIEVKSVDRDMMAMLDKAAVSYQVILTKCDALKPEQQRAKLSDVAIEIAKHPAAYPEILATSSLNGQNIDLLRAAIALSARG